MRIIKYLVFCFLAVMLLGRPVFAADDSIEHISVRITQDTSQALPLNAAKRMTKSVSTIGEQLLMGRKTSEVMVNRAVYEKLIHEVFDRVLVGYSIQEVRISPLNKTADISLKVSPWGETVRQVSVETDYGSASNEITSLIKQDIGNIQATLEEVLVGLPIESVDWAGTAAKTVVREMLEARLPEYRASLDITAGEHTLIKLTLSPVSPIVQNVHVSLRSSSIPNLLLEQIRPELETVITDIRGMPVAFIDRHRTYFTKRLTEATAEHILSKRYGITFTPSINAAAETEVSLKAETSLYNVALEGYLDMGKPEGDTSFKLHIGKNLSKQTEVFLETVFIPASVTWNFMPGMLYHRDYSAAGFKYDITNSQCIMLFNQYLGSNWSVRFERIPESGRNEVGLRYKMHEFISVEYVFTANNKWLRLVGHL